MIRYRFKMLRTLLWRMTTGNCCSPKHCHRGWNGQPKVIPGAAHWYAPRTATTASPEDTGD